MPKSLTEFNFFGKVNSINKKGGFTMVYKLSWTQADGNDGPDSDYGYDEALSLIHI